MSEYIYGTDEHGGHWLTGEEIVRCRDCVYNAKDTYGICYRFDHEHFNQPDGYCAWGERKDGGEMSKFDKLVCKQVPFQYKGYFTYYVGNNAEYCIQLDNSFNDGNIAVIGTEIALEKFFSSFSVDTDIALAKAGFYQKNNS